MTEQNDKPWWWPQIIDDDYIKTLRQEYVEDTKGLSDEDVLCHFDNGKKKGQFSITWDHIGDAYEEYEQLAKVFLKLINETGKSPKDFI